MSSGSVSLYPSRESVRPAESNVPSTNSVAETPTLSFFAGFAVRRKVQAICPLTLPLLVSVISTCAEKADPEGYMIWPVHLPTGPGFGAAAGGGTVRS